MNFEFGDFLPGKNHDGDDCMCLYWERKGVQYGIGYLSNLERSAEELSSVQHKTRMAMEITAINVLAKEE